MKKMFAAINAVAANAMAGEFDIASTEAMLKSLFAVKSQKGVTMIEYALIAALVAVVAIVAVGTLGSNVSTTFNHVATAINP